MMLRTLYIVTTLTAATLAAAPLHGQAAPGDRSDDLSYSLGAFAGFATGFTLSGLATHPELGTVRLYRSAQGGLLYGAEATARVAGPLTLVGSLARSRVSTIDSDSAGVWLGRAAAALSPGIEPLALTAGIALLRSPDMPVPTNDPGLHHAYVVGVSVEEPDQPWPGAALRFSIEDYIVRWNDAAVADAYEEATGIRPDDLQLDSVHALALRFGLSVMF